MRVCNLSSGSDGNVTYVETDNVKILVDIGLSCAEVCKRLKLLNVDGSDIDAILITHEHSDHIKGLDVFASKYKTKVFVHEKGMAAVFSKMKKLSPSQMFSFGDFSFYIKDLIVDNVSLPHDSVHCTGYIFTCNQRKFSIITDLGHTTNVILNKISGSSLVYLESNHDEKMLRENPNYSASLKARILGTKGHLSNLASAKVIEYLARNGTRQVMLSHLSRQNNTEVLAYTTVCDYLKTKGIIEGEHIKISVASILPSAIFKLN